MTNNKCLSFLQNLNKYFIIGAFIVLFARAAFAQYEPLKELTDLTKGIIYVKEKPPKTPKLEDLQLTDSATQYGITWKFDKPARIGQFINGDYYVVGPVTVLDITPKPLLGREVPSEELDKNVNERAGGKLIRNGTMLNPPAKREMSYDSGIRNWFNPALVTNVPYRLKPSDSLVSTISLKKTEVVNIFKTCRSFMMTDGQARRLFTVGRNEGRELPQMQHQYSVGWSSSGDTFNASLNSKTATRLVREWIDIRLNELGEDWELARAGKEVKKIAPLE